MLDRILLKSIIPYRILKVRRRLHGVVSFHDRVSKYLPRDPVILEAGANDGKHTLELSVTWPHGRIHAIEPIPESFSRLVRTTRFRSNVRWYQVALAEKTELRQMFVSDNSGLSSSLMAPHRHLDVYPDVHFPTTTTVLAQSLDDWAAQNAVSRIDAMWLDLQGYEPVVLRAAQRILSTVRVIQTEVNVEELYEGCVMYKEFRKFLEEQGFIVVFENFTKSLKDGDVIFVRKTLEPGA